MEKGEFNYLDIGGGLNLSEDLVSSYRFSPNQKILQNYSQLRSIKLASKNPRGRFTILDAYFPNPERDVISERYPNVEFIEYKLTINTLNESIPFPEGSFDLVELNHVYTPFQMQIETPPDFKTYPLLYQTAVVLAVRALRPGGNLVLCEKRESFERGELLALMQRVSRGLYRGYFSRYREGIILVPNHSNRLIPVRNRNRTQFVTRAFEQSNEASQAGKLLEAQVNRPHYLSYKRIR